MVFEFTEFTIATLLMSFTVFTLILMIDSERTNFFREKRAFFCLIGLVYWVVALLPVAFDQYQVNRAYDLSIPTNELSETELIYRQEKLESQKELKERAEYVDELLEQVNP